MGLNASNIKAPPKGDRVEQPVMEVGTYPARTVQLIDLGLQPQRPYEGEEKPPVHEVMLTYEFVDSFMVDKDGNELEDKPRWQSETFPFYSLQSERAKSTQRYKALDPDGVYGGDFAQTVNTPVNVTIVHGKNKKDPEKPYINIAGITAMRKRDAEKCPELKNPTKVFDLTDPDMEVFKALPTWLQDKIKGNLNFNGSPLQAKLGAPDQPEAKPAPVDDAPTSNPDVGDNSDDDNPF